MDIRQQTTQLLQQWQAQLWHWVPNVVSAVLILLLFWLLALASRWLCVRFDHRISGGQVHVGRLLGWAVYVFFLVSGAWPPSLSNPIQQAMRWQVRVLRHHRHQQAIRRIAMADADDHRSRRGRQRVCPIHKGCRRNTDGRL